MSVLFVYKFTVPSSTFIMAPIGNQFFQMAYVLFETFAQQQRERYTPYSESRLLVVLALSKTETHSTQTDLYVFNFSLPTGIHQFVPSLLHFSTHWAEKKAHALSGSRNIVTLVQPPIRVNICWWVGDVYRGEIL